MKNIYKISFIALFGIFVSSNLFAEKYRFGATSTSGEQKSTLAEACQPATGATDLDVNNVRCRINTGGDMWWDLQSVSRYYIPKDTKKTSMYSGSLWMAGVDVNGQLKCAAQRYRSNGNDFWPGPLSTDGSATVDAATCKKYDKHFKITRGEVALFIAANSAPQDYPDYKIPDAILNWPAHGDVSLGQDYNLAPFKDVDGDGTYDPAQGDYPWYDVDNETCNTENADRVLFGDQTLWWVFNDKGNVHSETQGSPVGFEIRAQAFGFATNDEINNMTFYNFQIINRSTYTLTDTYFSLWTDTDLGNAKDDYVGCDVPRGLGYCYNGKAVDGNGKDDEYGANPPAVGVDFFQGPYMDANGKDDSLFVPDSLGNMPLEPSKPLSDPAWNAINGVNFADGRIDNERFGMRRFVYHNNSSGNLGDPETSTEYYKMLRGIWKDGTKMKYGKTGHYSSGATVDCDFMFPGTTDEFNWGTGGVAPANKNWTEETAGNVPDDRRFMHSAGPFTLIPGAVNFITVGIPWARANSGGPMESVNLLKAADDKCQRLFDNCFRVVNGPDAPDLTIQELDKELVLYLSNPKTSNNYKELYPYKENDSISEYDFNIISPEGTPHNARYDSLYHFEGYLIYQLKDYSVSVGDIENVEKARLAAQCDIVNDITRIINYEFDESLGAAIPVEKVDGENKGIRHSFQITQDLFATGDKRLINHKKYYYIALAYGYNCYKKYSPDDELLLKGQKLPFKAGRLSSSGFSIESVVGIPHIPTPEASGTIANSYYGYGPRITRLEGHGNGALLINFTPETEAAILNSSSTPRINFTPEYLNNQGPIDVRVIDPLKVPAANFKVRFVDTTLVKYDTLIGTQLIDTFRVQYNNKLSNDSYWELVDETNNKVYSSDKAISVYNEQIFPEIGLGITIVSCHNPGYDSLNVRDNGFIMSSVSYEDPLKEWMFGVGDQDFPNARNWIRSGSQDPLTPAEATGNPNAIYVGDCKDVDQKWVDQYESFEKIAGGTWAPYRLASYAIDGPAANGSFAQAIQKQSLLSDLGSVDIVFTIDRTKWTRCPVIESCDDVLLSEGGAKKFQLRKGVSRNNNLTLDNSSTGWGWFPGYAICIETGERLNMMFSEDSWLEADNGRDMLFNPSSRMYTNISEPVFGGKHFVYVMGHNNNIGCPAYDGGQYCYNAIQDGSNVVMNQFFKSIWYVGIPMALPGSENLWLSNEYRIKIRVAKDYRNGSDQQETSVGSPVNRNLPLYSFSTLDLQTEVNSLDAAKSALDLINVVPNPYYAYSNYETSQLDNRVKIVNLPEKCEISIYNISGLLVRSYSKDEIKTSIDWDLKNSAGIPIASGLYLIHVKVDGVGERVIKWFGTLRPIDLDSF